MPTYCPARGQLTIPCCPSESEPHCITRGSTGHHRWKSERAAWQDFLGSPTFSPSPSIIQLSLEIVSHPQTLAEIQENIRQKLANLPAQFINNLQMMPFKPQVMEVQPHIWHGKAAPYRCSMPETVPHWPPPPSSLNTRSELKSQTHTRYEGHLSSSLASSLKAKSLHLWTCSWVKLKARYPHPLNTVLADHISSQWVFYCPFPFLEESTLPPVPG